MGHRRNLAITGSEDKSLRVWDLDAGDSAEPLAILDGHTATVTCVASDWAAGYALSGSLDCTIQLWHVYDGKHLKTFAGHEDGILCLAVNWKSHQALSGGADGALLLWELDFWGAGAGVSVKLTRHNGGVLCLAADWEAQRALTADSKGELWLWNLHTRTHRVLAGSALWRGVEASTEVRCVAMDWPSRRAVSGDSDGVVMSWDLENFEMLQQMPCHSHAVRCLSVDWQSHHVMTGAWKGALRVWDFERGDLAADLCGHSHTVASAEVDWVSRRACTASLSGHRGGGTLRVWDLEKKESVTELRGHTGSIRCLNANWGCPKTSRRNTIGTPAEHHRTMLRDLAAQQHLAVGQREAELLQRIAELEVDNERLRNAGTTSGRPGNPSRALAEVRCCSPCGTLCGRGRLPRASTGSAPIASA